MPSTAQRRATDAYRSALWKAELPPGPKFVGFAMSEFMDHKTLGDARPGPALITARTGLSIATVKRHLRHLVQAGWLTQTSRGGSEQRRIASVYQGIIPTRITMRRVNRSDSYHHDTGPNPRPVSPRHGYPYHHDTPPSPTGMDYQAGGSAPGPERAGAAAGDVLTESGFVDLSDVHAA